MRREIIRGCVFVLLAAFSLIVEAKTTDLKKVDIKKATTAKNIVDLRTVSIDSLIKKMTIEQKIAQMMVIRSGSRTDSSYIAEMQGQISKYGYGGVCFFKADAWSMYKLLNAYKSVSEIPLWGTIDGESGPAMRLTDVNKFPMQQTLGAIQDNSIIFEMGQEVGKQCRVLGLSWNYIPDVDINSNPRNPVINMRSFGENKENVASKAIAYYKGMSTENVMGSAKHFPGHGDTEKDSHVSLPIIKHDSAYIQDVDLYPFRKMIESGIESVMIGHLKVPTVDSLFPASLSKIWIEQKLRKEMGFTGIVVTDGLEMDGVCGTAKPGSGEVEVRAVEAGEDVLLLPVDPEAAIKTIAKAVKAGKISEARIDSSVFRILSMKAKTLHFFTNEIAYADSASLLEAINTDKAEAVCRKLYAQAITIVEDERHVLPIKSRLYASKACVHIGDYGKKNQYNSLISYPSSAENDEFGRGLDWFAKFDHYYIDKSVKDSVAEKLIDKLCGYDLVVIGVKGTSVYLNKKYGITNETKKLLSTLQTLPGEVVLSVFAPPYSLAFTDSLYFSSLLCGYQDVAESHIAMSQILFGGEPALGKLPVSIAARWPVNTGIETRTDILSYAFPEQIGFVPKDIEHLDSLIQRGIEAKAYPGCQVLVARKGKVFYDKSFGYFTYDKRQKVSPDDLYDIASLTKIFATTLSYMKLYDRGLYKLDELASKNIHRLQSTNKKNLTYRQLLSHEAGLKATLQYMKDSVYKGTRLMSSEQSSEYPIKIAESIFLYKGFRKILREEIDKSQLGNNKYLYSDLGFFYLYEALENMTEGTIEQYVYDHFYDSLGLEKITYHPLEKNSLAHIIPTEIDVQWRKQSLRGFVHDPLAALLGGACGSAGLFSNARDLAVLSQMLLQNGRYGGKRYIDSSTIALFTSSTFSSKENRRAGGFDKPALSSDQASPCARSASQSSYGHSGFTGTFFWVDPQRELVFIFLSNRVCPSSEPNKLVQMGIRTTLQDYINEMCDGLDKDASTNIIGRSSSN